MSEPIVLLERVVARDAAGPRGRPRGRLSHAQAALGPGAHAVLGTPEDGTLALADLLSGRTRPEVGRVRVGGQDPARHALTRARIGALLPAPDLPDARTVAAAVELAQRARGEASPSAAAALSPLGLTRLLERRPGSLSFAEARAVELALALSTPAPLLVVLFEPLAEVAIPEVAAARARLRELTEAGACAVVITSSPADARALGDHVHLLEGGTLQPAPAPPGGGELLVLVEEASPGVRALAAALTGAPGVQALAWEEAPPEARAAAVGALSSLRVRAPDLEAAALAIIDAAAASGVTIASITSPAPALRRARPARPAQPGGAR